MTPQKTSFGRLNYRNRFIIIENANKSFSNKRIENSLSFKVFQDESIEPCDFIFFQKWLENHILSSLHLFQAAYSIYLICNQHISNSWEEDQRDVKIVEKQLYISRILDRLCCVETHIMVKPNGFRKLFLLIHMSKPDNDCNSKIAQIIDEIFTIHVHPYSRRITSNIFWAHFHKENPSF